MQAIDPNTAPGLLPTPPLTPTHCPVVELRQYTLRPGQRDVLVELFEREFIEPQEAAGMRLIGQFRDLDDPDRFVWLRGFADMASRAASLQAFYGGPAWASHRDEANATMLDSDNVLLLRPAWPGADIQPARHRPRAGSTAPAAGALSARVYHLAEPAGAAALDFCRRTATPWLQEAGADAIGWYVTEPAANTFRRLPVREGEHVLVALAMFAEAASLSSPACDSAWERIAAGVPCRHAAPAQPLRLQPTPRSALHASA